MMVEASEPIHSIKPEQIVAASGILMSWYLMELLPELITNMFI